MAKEIKAKPISYLVKSYVRVVSANGVVREKTYSVPTSLQGSIQRQGQMKEIAGFYVPDAIEGLPTGHGNTLDSLLKPLAARYMKNSERRLKQSQRSTGPRSMTDLKRVPKN
jgi:hypothetical protein